MSTVRRSCYINPIEPQMFSLRVPSEMETWIETTFFDPYGAPYRQDMACQLHLTSRSWNRTLIYAMPSIDVVNGKTRAVIPQSDLTDMNGYRLRILGTYQQQPILLAIGNLNLIGGAGMQAYPDDIVDTIDLVFTRGSPVSIDVALWYDANKTSPYDLSAATVTALILDVAGGNTILPFTVALTGTNTVHLTLTDDQVDTLPDNAWWTLSVSQSTGQKLLAQGKVTVIT